MHYAEKIQIIMIVLKIQDIYDIIKSAYDIAREKIRMKRIISGILAF